MLKVGTTDVFERKYTEKFRVLASQFGEFVTYERDRGARDIGLHLTHRLPSGSERLSSSLCWFQLKGVMASTVPAEEFRKRESLSLSLEVNHLRYWFLQPMPTYLVVYIESVDQFLILNIQNYVTENWGRSILTLDQQTSTIRIPTKSVLDDQAFHLILVKGDVSEWIRALDANENNVRLCRRDFDLIWHLGTASERDVTHRVVYWDWQSKLRGQLWFQERARAEDSDWQSLREHWQLHLHDSDFEEVYPYVEFFVAEEDCDWDIAGECDDSEAPELTLSNGDVVAGINYGYEYFEYKIGVRLNELGQELYELVLLLAKMNLIEITPGSSEIIDVAPWNNRAV